MTAACPASAYPGQPDMVPQAMTVCVAAWTGGGAGWVPRPGRPSRAMCAKSVLRIMRSVMMSVTDQLLSRKRRRSMYLYQAYDFRKWLQDAALEAHLTAGDDEAPI